MHIERPAGGPVSYKDAGVNIDAATGALAAIKEHARSTFGDSGAAPIGHFGGTYQLPGGPDRLLVASADGIGTKLKLAFVSGGEAHFRVGADLVNHCTNDILACGARPLFFLDYVAMGVLEPDALERLVAGMAAACRENGLALIGGETAEMPGMYADGEYDAAGFIVGIVAPEKVIDGSAISAGDRLIGIPSVGLHTNGYSLARRIVGLTGERATDVALLAQPLPGDDRSIGGALLREHPTYVPAVLPLAEQGLIHGIAHITGESWMDAAKDRLRGYRQALEAADIPSDPALVREGDWSTSAGYEQTLVLMALPDPPTAIFCSNDRMAIGCYEALKELGLRIPQDVSVVGYDDEEVARHLNPPLTTLVLPHRAMGRWAVDKALSMVGTATARHHLVKLECPLIERHSVAAPGKAKG